MTERQRTDLSDLVKERRAELGLSLRALADLSVDPQTGLAVKFGWLNNLENAASAAPTPVQLRGLAVGLRFPVAAVQRAAAAQFFDMGEVWSGDHAARVLVARIEEMSPDDIAQLAEIAETFSRNRRSGGGQ